MRRIGLDYLKIVAMFMVVVLHVLVYTGGLDALSKNVYNISWLLNSFSYVAVDCFGLITGYLMYNKEFSFKRIIYFELRVVSVSVLVYVTLLLTKQISFSYSDFIISLTPNLLRGYWYTQAYMVVALIFPLINYSVKMIHVKDIKRIIFIITCIFSIFPSFFTKFGWKGTESGYLLLIFLYFYGALFRRMNDEQIQIKKIINNNLNKKQLLYVYGWGYLFFCILLFLSKVLIEVVGNIIKYDWDSKSIHFYSYNSIIVFPAAVMLFWFFQNINIKNEKNHEKIITSISNYSLTVYLLHMQPVLKNLYNSKYHIELLSKNRFYFIIFFLICIVVFIAGILLEILRSKVEKVILYKFINKT